MPRHNTFEALHNLYGILFGALNIRSVIRKLDDVKLLLSKSHLDYLTLNESWLNQSIDSCELEMDGYHLHHFDRDNGINGSGGGGIITYFNSDRNFVPIVEWNLCCQDREWTWIN